MVRLVVVMLALVVAAVGAGPTSAKGSGLALDRRAEVDATGTTVVVTGTARCPGQGDLAIHAHVRQTAVSDDGSGDALHADGYGVVPCGSSRASVAWRVTVFSPGGGFATGAAECFLSSSLDGAMAGSKGYAETTYLPVKLRPSARA